MSVETMNNEVVIRVQNMLDTMGIKSNTKSLVDYEKAKYRWAHLFNEAREYDEGLKYIVNWIGI